MLHVQDLMSTNLFTLKESDSLMAAKSLMELARIRHIPVVESGNIFLGIITHRDILSSTLSKLADVEKDVQDEIEAAIPVSEIMRTDVFVVAPDASLRDAAELLLNHKYGCLPVVEKDRLVGIITEADFLRLTIDLMDALDT
ncbi:CBS domain-containing protein [Halodesulfovibrio sp.]|jgi:CBS domain-containing membrane protein|uniref:CBS domain-containing protein n=1 Tax=Halodesulfovibrio sp. TaxID=1912772 RepID=UPI0025F7F291|nr:CBS domain-containing protein [Halodesulfovibrio sp.]MCT4534895.1 CBS domain-containing protein [Halodesulfovibrio sp.]MCT4627792.1 CBS domain-containing protein [Halodesulfovibrio sp.]